MTHQVWQAVARNSAGPSFVWFFFRRIETSVALKPLRGQPNACWNVSGRVRLVAAPRSIEVGWRDQPSFRHSIVTLARSGRACCACVESVRRVEFRDSPPSSFTLVS